MSSPTKRRTQRSSASATPRRSARTTNTQIPSSPGPEEQLQTEASQASQREPELTATPRHARLQTTSTQSQSPLFFRSSPAPATGSGAAQGDDESDGDATPKASGMNMGDSSPIHYASSSSPGRARNALNTDIRSSSSALFVRGSQSAARSRRSDIHSDVFGTSSVNQRRRLFVDEQGRPVPHEASDTNTFSNLNPNTSDADALGGNASRIIWGTNISLTDAQNAMKDFLKNFQKKYRMIQDGELDDGINLTPDHPALTREYVEIMNMMLDLGVTPLNLDCRNLKAYPPTRKLWHQLQAYPNEIIPLMDVAIGDVMVELAEKRMAAMRVQQSQVQRDAQTRARDSSSLPPMLSSDAPTPGAPTPQTLPEIPNLVNEVTQKTYNVRPFGLDHTINLRELNPGDMDKLVSVKGLVIRTTPIIPDMKDGT